MTSTPVNLICACGQGSSHNCPLEWDPQRLHSAIVRGRCPACGRESLFLGEGGHVTCRRAECPHPDAASTLLERGTQELEQLRQRVAELEASQATPHELELRQRRAWSAAGHCPMCSTSDTDGWLCDDCTATARRLPARERRGWRRYEPSATGTPIQSHGYTPAGLLGIDPQPPTA